MMGNRARIAAVLGATAMLSGCASASPFFSFRWLKSTPRTAHVARAPAFLALGREELDNGAYGSAIETFRLALATGENPAEALNGLGVAYAQLGRADVAEDLFIRAQQHEPNNPRFARNLVTLRQSQDSAKFARAALPPLELPGPRVDAVPAAPPLAESRVERLRRLPSGEMALRTFALDSDARAPTIRVTVAARATSAPAAPKVSGQPSSAALQPDRQVDLATPASSLLARPAARPKSRVIFVDPRFSPVVRIVLPQSKPAKATTSFARAGL